MILLFAADKSEIPSKAAELARWQSQTGHRLIRRAASFFCHVAEESIVLQRGVHGKPEWNLPIHFNLSHSGKWIAAAFSFNAELGIDIEDTQKNYFTTELQTDAEPFIRRFFHPRDLELWKKAAPAAKDTLFLQLWTMKEALLKGCGSGLSVSAQDFSLHPDTAQTSFALKLPSCASATLWKAKDKDGRYQDWNLVSLPPDDFVCSLAYRVLRN